MSKASKSLIQFLCASVAVMLLAVALNFVVDPLQLFRPARFYQPMYSNDSRMQDAGLIRSQSFDTVFMGTSLAIHVRRVIWQMDDWIFRDAPDVDSESYFPANLYRRNARGIAEYLFSGAMARE